MSTRSASATFVLASTAAIGSFATCLAPALAADAPPSTTDSSESLETVYVTAQRRSERAQDVPITITTLSTQQLDDANINNLSGIATVTPAFVSIPQAHFRRPLSAASGPLWSLPAQVRSRHLCRWLLFAVAVGCGVRTAEHRNIQVLKGPQGTLFGYNTTGGAILVTTAKPSTETKGLVAGSYGNYNTQRYEGYFTTGLTDRLAFESAGIYRKGDGLFRKHRDRQRQRSAPMRTRRSGPG